MIEKAQESESNRRGRYGPWVLLAVALALAIGWGALVLLSGRAVVAPAWLTDRVEARAALAMGGPGRLEIGSIVAVLVDRKVPRIVLRDLRLRNALGAELARVPEVRARLAPGALLSGRIELTRLTVVGAELTLRRDRAGRLDLAFGGNSGALQRATTLPAILAAIEAAFARPALAKLDTVSGEALRLTFQDALTGRIWRAENGSLSLSQTALERRLDLGFALAGGAGTMPAAVKFSFAAARGAATLDFAAEVANIPASDVASQVPALAWLTAIDAPLTATLGGSIGADGALAALDGALDIGAGALSPGGAAHPLAFQGAHAALAFDPAAGKIIFSDLRADTPEARFRATGQAYLRAVDPTSGRPAQLLLQLALSDILLNPQDELAEPLRFDAGAVDLRLTLAPFRIELGQLALVGDGRQILASGSASAEPDGWHLALDLGLDQLPHDRLLALWPLRLVAKTRLWLSQNVTEGLLYNVRGAVRIRPGAEPRLALGYEFEDGTVRFMPALPPIEGGSGHAAIFGKRYTMSLTGGEVRAPNGELIDATASSLVVPDITIIPAPAEIRLETSSSIPAALTLLDERPFEFFKKAGLGTDLAQGEARLSAVVRMPLAAGVPLTQIDFSVNGTLSGVRSDTLVPGKVLEADSLSLAADKTAVSVGGTGHIGGARFDAAWRQPLGPGTGGGSRVEGSVILDQAFLDEFGIALPRGSVSGAGRGQITLELERDAPPRFRLTSDLAGLGLAVPAIGWSMGRGTTGSLEVAGALGRPARIDRIALSGPGLEAVGRVTLSPQGAFASARFDRVRVGRWLNAPVELTSRGAGRAPAVAVTGGSIDLRETELSGRGGAGGPITLALDRLTVSEGIVFSGLRANLSTQGGLSGRFTGRLAGQAPVEGVLAPSQEGTSVRIQAADAGAVLRASGLLQSAQQGRLDLTLVPLPGEGRYDGRLAIDDLRIRGAPALAELLSAVSVVGLLEQLNGQGIVFSQVTGEFTLEPRGVTIRRGSAVGASLGVSMEGVYDLRSKELDMQGTVSPIYLVNAIGSIFTRRGEGLFGFTYRMTGPASAPRTSVNPLSILTPGMFREIFRAAPPELSQ